MANNLYSRFVTISEKEIAKLEKDLRIEIKTYNSNFNQNMKTVEIVEEFILKKMGKLIPLPAECYKTQINDKKSKQQDQ